MFAHWHGDYKQVDNLTFGPTVLHGSAVFDSSIKKFGTHSLKCSSTSISSYDLIKYVRSDNYQSYNWTVEFWLNVQNIGRYEAGYRNYIFKCGDISFDIVPNGSTNNDFYNINVEFTPTSGYGGYYYASVRGGEQFPCNTWIHFCIESSGGIIATYFNGYLDRNQAQGAGNFTQDFLIGRNNDFSGYLGNFTPSVWHIDELRISNIARYNAGGYTTNPPTRNFTPATSAFTTDSNTLFLGHFDNSL